MDIYIFTIFISTSERLSRFDLEIHLSFKKATRYSNGLVQNAGFEKTSSLIFFIWVMLGHGMQSVRSIIAAVVAAHIYSSRLASSTRDDDGYVHSIIL
jgi:hypothetical protein